MRSELRSHLLGQIAGAAMALGGYDSAKSSRLSRDKDHIRGGSADSHRDFQTRDNQRRRCQELDRNNVLARGLVQRLIDMIVGDGFPLKVTTEDPEWNQKAQELFGHWAGTNYSAEYQDVPQIDIRGRASIDDMAAEIVRCACVDGDVGYIKTNSGQVQGIEAERIRNPSGVGLDGLTPQGTLIVGGVEMDGAGRPLQYHVAAWMNSAGAGSFPAQQTQAVDADHLIFLSNPLRNITGATRGEPQLQACVSRFEHLDGFDEAVRVAARIQAILSAFIIVERPVDHQGAFPGTTRTVQNLDGDDEDVKQDELEPGMLNRLRPGESIETVAATQPGPDYQTFVLTQLSQICADLGLPLPLATLDARLANLSSMRCVLQLAWRNFERWQEWLRCKWYAEVYRWRVAMFIREGLLPYRDDWAKHEWLTPPQPVLDPKLEVEANRAMVDAGFAAPSRVMQKSWGIDSATEFPRIGQDRAAQKLHNAEPVAAPGATNVQPKPEPKPAPEDDPNADDGN